MASSQSRLHRCDREALLDLDSNGETLLRARWKLERQLRLSFRFLFALGFCVGALWYVVTRLLHPKFTEAFATQSSAEHPSVPDR